MTNHLLVQTPRRQSQRVTTSWRGAPNPPAIVLTFKMKIPVIIIGVLIIYLKYTLYSSLCESQRMTLWQTSSACISLLWRASEEVQGLPGCADRPQDQRRRQKAMVGTRGCKAATASNQKKVTYQQRSFFLIWKSPEKVCQRGFMGPVMCQQMHLNEFWSI